jgi:hypothetical protein
MRRSAGVAALLLAALGCTEDAPPEEYARNLYPLSSQGLLVRGERDAPAVFVRMGAGGRLEVKDGARWTDATLDELGALLAGRRDALRIGGRSRLFVSIEADSETPWQHILWLMTIAAERKCYKLELSDGKRRLLALLPVDQDPPLPPYATVRVVLRVHVVAGTEKEAVVYRFREKGDGYVIEEYPDSAEDGEPARTGPAEADDLASVPRWIEEVQGAEKDDADSLVSGEIRAGNKVPFARVLDVMECFLDHGLPMVNFHSTGGPDADMRKSKRLPYPTGN